MLLPRGNEDEGNEIEGNEVEGFCAETTAAVQPATKARANGGFMRIAGSDFLN